MIRVTAVKSYSSTVTVPSKGSQDRPEGSPGD